MKAITKSLTLTPDEKTLAKMREFYSEFSSPAPNPYIELFARGEGVVVSLYRPNSSGVSKVVFQGLRAEEEAGMWGKVPETTKQPRLKKPLLLPKAGQIVNLYPQIGSDEVGTGDFFGPICVAASYVEEQDLVLIDELGVTDSKKMEDPYILEIGPKLIARFPYSQLSLDNPRYNSLKSELNMNEMKAKMHNRCDLNLLAKFPSAHLYQDQFAEEGLYYHYLRKEKEVAKGIFFHTKGESLFPSVALGSVIARYSFLRKMAELSAKYQMDFPFGAGEKVDDFAKEFIERYSIKELEKVAKLNFQNYKRLS